MATLATVLAQLDEHASIAAERDLLGPVYAAAEALLLGAAGGVARGQEALERAVGDLAKDGIEKVGPRVTLCRSYRRLGREVAVLVHAALADARALEPIAAEPEPTTPALRARARRLAILLLAASVLECGPGHLVRLASAATRHVLVGVSSLEPWQVVLKALFARPPWAVVSDERIDPPQDPRQAVRTALATLLLRTDDAPKAFRTPTEEQMRRAVAFMRTLRIRHERPGGGWVTPFGAAKRFAQCFDCDTFPRKETEAGPRARRARSPTGNGAPK